VEKLEILFVSPVYSFEEDCFEKTNVYPIAGFRLEAFCKDLANFDHLRIDQNFNFDFNFNKKYDIIAISTTFFLDRREGDKNLTLEYYTNLVSYFRKNSNAKIFEGGFLHFYFKEVEEITDFVCYYEGEKPFRRAIEAVRDGKPLTNSKEPEPLTEKEMNLLPPMRTDYFNGIIPILLSYGCPSHCIYCVSNRTAGKKIRHPSLKKIKSDIDYYIENGINTFIIIDNYIFCDKAYYMEVFKYFDLKKVRITLLFLNMNLSDEELDILCKITSFFNFTPDASNERIFNTLGKVGNFYNVKHYIEYIRKKLPYAIISIQYLIGYPGETEEDRQEGFEFFNSLPVDLFFVLPVYPIKGSKLYELFNNNFEIAKYVEPIAIIAGNLTKELNKGKSMSIRETSAKNIFIQDDK
jgi:pyruvate-formate lyase-activating enzyme